MTDNTVRVIQSVKGGMLFEEQEPVMFYPMDKEKEKGLLCIYPEVRYQEWEGFGGALTESVAHNLCRMEEEKRKEVLRAYFDEEQGLGMNFCRVNIGSCDFSTEVYSYDDTPKDYELEDFNLEHDCKELIPMLLEAIKMAPDLKILSSPWSPPAWMKTNGDMENGGALKVHCRQVWADYLVKYVKEYRKAGIPVWGITVQNEAMAKQTWESCIYTAEEEKDFVKRFLGPSLWNAGEDNIRILIWDHNKEKVVERSTAAMEDEEAAKYIYGAAVHWYSGDHFDALRIVHEKYPGLRLFSTENSMGRHPKHFWEMGERIAHGIIGELNSFVSSWFVWNLILDENGLPNHDHPIGKSPMMVDYSKGGELYYDSSYYYLMHFCRYIRPGARRIASSIYSETLETITFLNQDNSMVTVVLNRTEKEQEFTLCCEKKMAEFISKGRSIMTLCY